MAGSRGQSDGGAGFVDPPTLSLGWPLHGRGRGFTLITVVRQGHRLPSYLRPKIHAVLVLFNVLLGILGSGLLRDKIDRMLLAVRMTRARRPFRIDAWVVLPDHLHAIWRLPGGGRRRRDAQEADQGAVFGRGGERRSAAQPHRAGRTRSLAAALLGTPLAL